MSTSNIFDLADTWNDAAVTFNGIKLNVTDTASAAASNLLDLQVGGDSRLSVSKTGEIRGVTPGAQSLTMNPSIGVNLTVNRNTSNAISVILLSSTGNLKAADGSQAIWSSSGFRVSSGHSIGFSPSAIGSSAPDVSLFRDAADTLAQRRSTNAQTFNLYNSFTDASNHERARLGWAGNVFEIKPQAEGTGTVRTLHMSGLPTSDPAINGVLWNDAGTVKVSAG